MFDPLLWVLHHFVTHYAGQTTQGDTDDDDGGDDHGDYFDQTFDYNPKSKKADRLLQKSRSMNRHRLLQGSDITDEIDAFSFMDSKSKIGAKVQLEVESYYQGWNADQYDVFVGEEIKYFGSEYFIKKKLSKGQSGMVHLAIKRSNGLKVTCKFIRKKRVEKYALESIPPPRCNLRNPLGRPKDQSAAQCMSPRPPNLYVAHELLLQMYLSRPGHENPYVLMVLDYITLQDKFMLIVDHLDESWMSLLSYMNEKKRLGIDEVRKIIKEVIHAVISLKQHGVFHKNIHGSVKLTNFDATDVVSGWKERELLQSLDPSPTVPEYEAGPSELRVICTIGQLLSKLLTGIRVYKDDFNYEKLIRETILPDPDPSQSALKEKAIHLVNILVSRDPKQMPSLEAILNHSFFD
ncbi:hypothetical protein BASA50_009161 [Batrachochytrium salamandrivorans]|uniref:non-specific serine/threonine protein kinase n=1 Tax=Batrachochytrium salamandrivorans TaxID=1357716 RepID=A0ABQ8F2N2_9FUNG|nr:hypothetical protein BASA50_009161 [Batrachochytrium salamandrivorans]